MDKNKICLDSNQFHELHISATTKCLEEFERLTQSHPDLNTEYEFLLVNDLRGLYSSYFLINNNKKKTFFYSITDRIYSYLNPDDNLQDKNQIRFSVDSGKKNHKNSSFFLMNLFNIALFVMGFFFNLAIKSFIFLFDLLVNFNFQYSAIFKLFFHVLKSMLINLSSFSFNGLIKTYRLNSS